MPRKLKRPVEEVRAELLADPHTRGIAEKLGMPVAAYVELVLDYAQNPEKKPEFDLIPEGEAKARGVATTEEVRGWFEAVAAGKVDLREPHERDDFQQSPEGGRTKAPVELGEVPLAGSKKGR
jgi:hypothetical protein